MNYYYLGVLCIIFCIACGRKQNAPDVSQININMEWLALDKLLFESDTIQTAKTISAFKTKHKDVFNDYTSFVCRSNINDSIMLDTLLTQHIKYDRVDYDSIVKPNMPNVGFIKDELVKALKYQKYYFPNSNIRGKAYSYYFDPLFNNGSNFLGITLGAHSIGFGIQFYMGKNFMLYNDRDFIEVAPQYRSRKFSREYMVSDAIQKIIEMELYKPLKDKTTLIEQMVEKGKQWYIKKKLLPNAHDTIITGFTMYQLQGSLDQEGLIWKNVLDTDPQSNDPTVTRSWLSEAPYTAATGNVESPGNLGQWVGLKIVEAYAKKNSSASLQQILSMLPNDLLEKSGYRPK
jgi:hypothetical protein